MAPEQEPVEAIEIEDTLDNAEDYADENCESDDEYDYDAEENDGQPSEYDEWQDFMGGDDSDHGQYDGDEY